MHELGFGQRTHRHHAAARIPHINVLNFVDPFAKRRLRLQIDLPGSPENVEVVDVVTAQRRLQGVKDVADPDTQHLCFVAIDVEKNLRRVGSISAEYASELGLAIGGHQQPAQHCCEIGVRLSLQRFQDVLETARASQADNRRQVKRKGDGAGDRCQ